MNRGLYEPSTERAACGVGFVAQLGGAPRRTTVTRSLEILGRLAHRGACGGDNHTGDGAGILVQIPHEFFSRRLLDQHGVALPEYGRYGVGMLFLPAEPTHKKRALAMVAKTVEELGLIQLVVRDVPINSLVLGTRARETLPHIAQIFIGMSMGEDEEQFQRRLFVFRRLLEKRAGGLLSIPSLSSRTIVYKGLLLSPQIAPFYLDLAAEDFVSNVALVHQRYSTNTFPSWPLAHPFRYLCHNGEINALRGNLNWLRAREALLQSPLFGSDLQALLPLIPEGLSDSASLDAMLELLVQCGRSLPHALAMLVPEAWEKHGEMSDEKRAFYEYHACLQEPWDGPALVAFTDAQWVGALLDRNGLRPARYCVTDDGDVILSSEAGAAKIAPERILEKGRLEPGKMLLVNLAEGRIVADSEIKQTLAGAHPYRDWLSENMVRLEDLPPTDSPLRYEKNGLLAHQRTFGYTAEDLATVMTPMANSGEEPIGSMGADIPLAVLSERPLSLFDYFKQLFAQVTNPPLDAIREEIVTSTFGYLGAQGNILADGPEHTRRLRLDSPVITDEQLAVIKDIDAPGLRAITLAALFPGHRACAGGHGEELLEKSLAQLSELAGAAVDSGSTIIVLSDRGADGESAPIPSVLACSAVHHALIKAGKRARCSIVVESGEVREVHHVALLLGYGASAVNPYLALASVRALHKAGKLAPELACDRACKNYLSALKKGVVKVTSKMGIAVLQSYCGAQIFEALGLESELVAKYFPGTSSRIGGATLREIAEEAAEKHKRAFGPLSAANILELDVGGDYQWRRQGEKHLNNPQSVAKLQHAVRQGSFATFREYSALIDEQSRVGNTLRGLLEFLPAKQAVPLGEVEPAREIVRRFRTGAMSFGSISFEAHANLALAMNRIGGRSNSGEGGEEPLRDRSFETFDEYRAAVAEVSPWTAAQLREGDSLRSAIRQVASARFGVTSEYLARAEEIQIKIAQGAKPGEGEQLPGHKVDHWIAKVRHATPGVTLISPPPHHDIYSIEDLAELIYDLKSANPQARISVKLVSEVGVGTVAAGVAKAKADAILISGADGGTGASPLSSIKHAGLPWELGVAEAHQVLVANGLREAVVLETDGQLKTGRDVAVACLLGAEEFGFSTAPMIAQGCVMMRKCHLNTCPVGIATQDPELRTKFTGTPEHVINFVFYIAEELRTIMAELGFRTVSEMIGRIERVQARNALDHWKARGLNLQPMLYSNPFHSFNAERKRPQEHDVDRSLDAQRLINLAEPALSGIGTVYHELSIDNTHRAVGAQTGCVLTRLHGPGGLPENSIHFKFNGSAGQSFGAFVPRGMTLEVEGEVNDYCGKGLSGGTLIVYPPRQSRFIAEEQIIGGNVAFYGATAGTGFIRGRVGERFCVRNSGAEVVVEGVGEHGCEYMTGGRVLILGAVGRNFAAGMSGGIALVYDTEQRLERRCNRAMVELEKPDNEDLFWIREMLGKHQTLTGSVTAAMILTEWESRIGAFVKVIPSDYRRALERAEDAGDAVPFNARA